MDIFILNQYFEPVTLIERFISAIWVERYTKSGDVTILTEASDTNLDLLKEGVLLGLADSDEVMQIENALEENGTLKVTGETLDVPILGERIYRWTAQNAEDSVDLGFMNPAHAMMAVVSSAAISSDLGFYVGLDKAKQKFTGLSLGDEAVWPGTYPLMKAKRGSALENILPMADTYQIGYSLYLESINLNTHVYSLKFKTYIGVDRTSAHPENGTVKFSPSNDSLTNISKLRSISGYKTIAYAYAPDLEDGSFLYPGVANVPGGYEAIDFNRRELIVEVNDATIDNYGTVSAITDYLVQAAKDALANNNYTKVIDGEIVPQSQFKFGVDYLMGDLIELDDNEGNTQAARITEYIRSQDETGERAYPTVSVID